MRSPTRLLALLLLAAGCAANTPDHSRTLSDRAAAVLARAPQFYGPTSASVAATNDNAKLRAAFEAALEPQARVRLRHDPALDLVAESLAENFSDRHEHTSPALAQWLFWRSGSIATYYAHSGGSVRWGRGSSSRSSAGAGDSLEQWAKRAAEHVNATPTGILSYGLARFSAGKVTAETIVFGHAPFDVEPFAKTYAPGGPLTLALRPRIPQQGELRLLLDRGDTIEEQVLAPRPDGSFFISRSVPAKPGRYFLEIQGPGRRTLLWLPIYVGVPEPAAPDAFIQSPPPAPPDAAEWPRWLADLYGAERAKVGKAPLAIEPRLSALCAQRSAQHAAGRRLEPTDSAAFQAQLGGLALRDLDETITVAETTDAVFMNLLRPSFRQRIVFGDGSKLGAGASLHPAKDEQPARFTLVEETALPTP